MLIFEINGRNDPIFYQNETKTSKGRLTADISDISDISDGPDKYIK